MKRGSPQAYQRWFVPSSSDGPSGLRNRPRPFVLRVSHLEGGTIPAGSPFCAGLNVFDPRAVQHLSQAMAEFAPLESIEDREVNIPLEGLAASCGRGSSGIESRPQGAADLDSVWNALRIRVHFLTPTELKSADDPEFAVLWSRLRDRISTLRALYGPGPLQIDFKATAERAARIQMTRCEIENVAANRVSGNTGQRHSIGGFVGFAEYEGGLGEFIPYLEIGRHTGVGRQTVWGKGEIGIETF